MKSMSLASVSTGNTSVIDAGGFAGSMNLRWGGDAELFAEAMGFVDRPDGWTLFYGRLDGRSELAATLGVRDDSATPDLELVRLAIDRWEEKAPQRLLGDFAVAAWRNYSQRLILAADVSGLATVYYWREGDRLSFATNLRAVLANSAVPLTLNETFLVDCLALNHTDDDATVYRDVRRVAAGACVVITADETRVAFQHRFDPHRRIHLSSDEEYEEAAWELLRRAVNDRLRGSVLPILGSSGLDSACVAAAVAANGEPFDFLTAIPDLSLPTSRLHPRQKNEQQLVEVMAAGFPQMQAKFFAPAQDRNWSPDWQDPLRYGCAPDRSPMQIAWLSAPCRHAALSGATSYLGGAGGNLTLTWDGWRQLPSMVREGKLGSVARELVLGCEGRTRRFAGLTWREVVKPLAGGRYWYRSLAKYCGLRAEAVREAVLLDRMRERGSDPQFIRSLDSRQWRIEALYRGRARRPELTNMLHGLHGVRQTTPLLDPRLIDFCLAIPDEQYLRQGVSRRLARRLLQTHGVPREVAENRRHGYQHPEWFAHLSQVRTEMGAQVAGLRLDSVASRLLDLDRLDHILRNWPADADAAETRRAELSSVLAATLAIGAFLRWSEGGVREQSLQKGAGGNA